MLIPCKACGAACGSSCKAVEFCCCPANRPSPIFMFFTMLMNGLVILFAIIGLSVSGDTSFGSIDVDDPNKWLIVMTVIAVVNMIFSVYIYCRFHTMTSRLPDQTGGANPQAPMSPWGAAWKLMMYDIGVCCFIILGIFTIVWLFVRSNYECPSPFDESDVCKDKEDAMDNVAICMWIYTLLGGFVIAFSLCTQCCNKPKHQQVVVVNQQPGQYVPPHQAAAAYPQQQQQQPAYPASGYPQQQYPQHQQQYPQHQQQEYPAAPAAYPPQQPGYPPQQSGYPAPEYPPQTDGGYPAPAGQYPPQQQYRSEGTTSEKVGNAVGAVIGKGINALKK